MRFKLRSYIWPRCDGHQYITAYNKELNGFTKGQHIEYENKKAKGRSFKTMEQQTVGPPTQECLKCSKGYKQEQSSHLKNWTFWGGERASRFEKKEHADILSNERQCC